MGKNFGIQTLKIHLKKTTKRVITLLSLSAVFIVGVGAFAVEFPEDVFPATGKNVIRILRQTFNLTEGQTARDLPSKVSEGTFCLNCLSSSSDPTAQGRSEVERLGGAMISIAELWREAEKADGKVVTIPGTEKAVIRVTGFCPVAEGGAVPCDALKGNDPRKKIFNVKEEGLGGLGYVYVRDRKSGEPISAGTGFMINKCLMLTAGHVVTGSPETEEGNPAGLTKERAENVSVEFRSGNMRSNTPGDFEYIAKDLKVVGGIQRIDELDPQNDYGVLKTPTNEIGEKAGYLNLQEGLDFMASKRPIRSEKLENQTGAIPSTWELLENSEFKVMVASVGDTGFPTLQSCGVVKKPQDRTPEFIAANNGLMNLNCSVAHGGSGGLAFIKYNGVVIPIGLVARESEKFAVGAAVKTFSNMFVQRLFEIIKNNPCD